MRTLFIAMSLVSACALLTACEEEPATVFLQDGGRDAGGDGGGPRDGGTPPGPGMDGGSRGDGGMDGSIVAPPDGGEPDAEP